MYDDKNPRFTTKTKQDESLLISGRFVIELYGKLIVKDRLSFLMVPIKTNNTYIVCTLCGVSSALTRRAGPKGRSKLGRLVMWQNEAIYGRASSNGKKISRTNSDKPKVTINETNERNTSQRCSGSENFQGVPRRIVNFRPRVLWLIN